MNVYEAIIQRRSIRRFKDRSVPYSALERCVNAARLAPSARNRQPLEYVIVDSPEKVRELSEMVTLAGTRLAEVEPVRWPKAFILTLINNDVLSKLVGSRDSALQDVGLAVENIMLTALEEGLGSCPVAMIDKNKARQLLNIPDRYEISLAVPLGYPDESSVEEVYSDSTQYWVDDLGVRHVPKRRLEDIVHLNGF